MAALIESPMAMSQQVFVRNYCYGIAQFCLGLNFCLDIIMVTDALYHIHVTKKVHTAISYVIFTSACSAEICKDILIHFFVLDIFLKFSLICKK